MGNIIKIYRQFSAGALLLIFLLYFGNINLFTHTHNVDGVKISHSHIYSGTESTPNHSHSAQQFNIIYLLSTFSSDELIVGNTAQAFISLVDVIHQRVISRTTQCCALFLSLRAPPAMV